MKLKLSIFLCGLVLCLTACTPYYDYEEHTADFYVCNYSDKDISLKIDRTVSSNNKGSYESNIIRSKNQSYYNNDPEVTISWIPGKYYIDIDGFVTSNRFYYSFYDRTENKKYLEMANCDGSEYLYNSITRSISVTFSIHQTFIPQNFSYREAEVIDEYVTDEEDLNKIKKVLGLYAWYDNQQYQSAEEREQTIRYVENLVENDSELKNLLGITDTSAKNYVAYSYYND